MVDFLKIEKKWQNKWEISKAFEANPNKRTKFFLTFPYPYINLSPHIGHFYTLMRVEAFARYKRLKGFNVLFPQGFHATGSPIVAAAERVKEREPKQLELLRKEGFSNKEIKRFENPEYWIKVFEKKWQEDLKCMGLSIDWRRKFITTSLNPHYDRFVKWQFKKLKEMGLIIKGEHPVVWDPKTNMPVGDHDRIEGEGEVPQEFCLFKFTLSDGRKIITATLRPDTILGITNIYVNPNVEYAEIKTKGEIWIVGKPTIEKLKNQNYDIKIKGKVVGKDLIGKKAELFGNKILILPASFLNPEYGTGIVHSVPSESADDLIALKDLKNNKELINKFNIDQKEISSLEPIEILETPGIGKNPAQYFLDKYDVRSQQERDKLDKIRHELYTLSFSTAKLGKLYKKGFSRDLSGVPVSRAQKIIKEELLKKNKINLFYELTGKVVSRNLTECIVKIVKDQWFIKYSDKKWKKQVQKALINLELYPEDVRGQFKYVIDWLNDWACTREYGLGTRLPFDERWLVESLSDSTIYMAYYTIANLIKDIPVEKINDNVFDYIFLNKKKKPNVKNIERLKKEFEYWYPLDFRNSGKDLVQNHLAFFLFNHVAIFGKKHWPKAVGVNGWVRVDGQKMSKSLGNVIPLKNMGSAFGADASRVTILNGGESLDDPNWDSNFAEMIKSRFSVLHEFSINNYNKGKKTRKEIDNWMDNELNRIIEETDNFMEKTLFRSAIQKCYFDLQSKIKWYLRRTNNPNKDTINRCVEVQIILLSPFAPHICEEIWSSIGKKEFVSLTKWPKIKKVDFKGDEEYIKKVRDDINNLIKLVKFKPKKICLYAIPLEKTLLKEETNFFNREFNLDCEIYAVNDKNIYDPNKKSKLAKKGRVSIYLE